MAERARQLSAAERTHRRATWLADTIPDPDPDRGRYELADAAARAACYRTACGQADSWPIPLTPAART